MVAPYDEGYDPHLVAAMLSYEEGIAVRSGSFCAQAYVRRLLSRTHSGCEPGQPGLVRVSVGLSTTHAEIDRLVQTLREITAGSYDGLYRYDKDNGAYVPQEAVPTLESLFAITGCAGPGRPLA